MESQWDSGTSLLDVSWKQYAKNLNTTSSSFQQHLLGPGAPSLLQGNQHVQGTISGISLPRHKTSVIPETPYVLLESPRKSSWHFKSTLGEPKFLQRLVQPTLLTHRPLC